MERTQAHHRHWTPSAEHRAQRPCKKQTCFMHFRFVFLRAEQLTAIRNKTLCIFSHHFYIYCFGIRCISSVKTEKEIGHSINRNLAHIHSIPWRFVTRIRNSVGKPSGFRGRTLAGNNNISICIRNSLCVSLLSGQHNFTLFSHLFELTASSTDCKLLADSTQFTYGVSFVNGWTSHSNAINSHRNECEAVDYHSGVEAKKAKRMFDRIERKEECDFRIVNGTIQDVHHMVVVAWAEYTTRTQERTSKLHICFWKKREINDIRRTQLSIASAMR